MAKKTELVVDPEFAALMPPQTEEERAKLEESLLANGCMDPLKAHTETGILLDGHTRKALCDKHDIRYTVEWVSVPGGREGARAWVIAFAFSRRNLTELQKSVLRGMDYLAQKKSVGRPVKDKPDTFPLVSAEADAEKNGDAKGASDAATDTASLLAAKYNVDARTIVRDADLAKAVAKMPLKAREEFLAGKSELTRTAVLEKYAPKKREIKKPQLKKKPGAPKFPWAEFQRVYERAVRGVDEIARAYDSKGSNEHRRCLSLLEEFDEKVKEWRKRLEAKEAAQKE